MNIQELSLTGFFGFSASGLPKIGKNCPKLPEFSLDFDDYIPGTYSIDITSALRSLATHNLHLQILSLKFLKGNLRELSRLSTLISLSIHTYRDQQACHDYPLATIVAVNKNLKEFVYFNSFSPLNDVVVLMIIQNCRKLEKRFLVAKLLTESSLPHIMDCKVLTSLALDGFHSHGKALALLNFSGMELKEFSLRNCKNIQELSRTGFVGFSASALSKIGKNSPKLIEFSLDFGDYVPHTYSIDITSALRSLPTHCLHLQISSIDITSALVSLPTHCLHLQISSLKFPKGNLREMSGLSTLIALSIDTYGDQQACPDYSLATIVAANKNLKSFVYFNWSSPLNDAAVLMII